MCDDDAKGNFAVPQTSLASLNSLKPTLLLFQIMLVALTIILKNILTLPAQRQI